MKPIHIVFAIIIFSLASNSQLTAQINTSFNLEAKDSRGNMILLGKSTRERLQQDPFGNWFNKNYSDYTVDTATANQLKPFLQNKHFTIFMGTWCGDSRREVPRIYKLLDYCGIPLSQVQLINVNSSDTAYKQSPGHEERGLNIHRVPDLLVYDNDKEIGRVIESPIKSWEKDLFAITTGQAYEPNYKGVIFISKLFQSSSPADMRKNMLQLSDQLRPLVQNRYELNSYGNIQLSLHETEKALLLYQLNTLLFPNEPEVWNSLAAAITSMAVNTKTENSGH